MLSDCDPGGALVYTLFPPQGYFSERLVRREGSILSLKSVDKGIYFQKKSVAKGQILAERRKKLFVRAKFRKFFA